MTAKGWMAMTMLAMACWTAQGEGWRTYEQILTLTFETEAQARLHATASVAAQARLDEKPRTSTAACPD